MTIHDKDRFMAGLWDWAVLNGCFGNNRISPTDVDGLVERNGHFLFLEAKAPKATIPEGQRITLTQLSRQPNTIAVVLFGDPATKSVSRIQRIDNGTWTDVDNPSLEMLRLVVSGWNTIAERRDR